jgi:Kef-type K+ transport system membrane component KefB
MTAPGNRDAGCIGPIAEERPMRTRRIIGLVIAIVALPLLVVVSALAGDEFRWRDALVNAVVLTAASYAIFVWGLKLTLPIWPVR